jgi:hypothetical protein
LEKQYRIRMKFSGKRDHQKRPTHANEELNNSTKTQFKALRIDEI